jgi:hypothetical protein
MKSAEVWIKLLFVYGPFAILVFLVFVTELKLRTAMKEAAGSEKKTLTRVYILNWVAVFGLVIFSVYAWKRINLDRKPTIEGRIERLLNSETLTTSSADLYLHRIPVSTRFSDYEWLLVNKDKQFDAGAKIKFLIDRSNANGGDSDVYEYELPIQSDFYDKAVQLRRDKDKLFLNRNGAEIELQGTILPSLVNEPLTARNASTVAFLATIAYTQSEQYAFSKEDFAVGLESPDAIVRRSARAELARQGAQAIPWIEEVLANPKSSYRLKLGVIVALNNIAGLSAESLKPSTLAAIRDAGTDSDDALRNEAQSFMSKYGYAFTGDSPQPVIVYEHIDYTGRSQIFMPGKYRADQGEFGNLPNDSASSLRVAKGYRVRLCDSEGKDNGAGKCRELGEGSYQLKGEGQGEISDTVSFIYVFKAREARPTQSTAPKRSP